MSSMCPVRWRPKCLAVFAVAVSLLAASGRSSARHGGIHQTAARDRADSCRAFDRDQPAVQRAIRRGFDNWLGERGIVVWPGIHQRHAVQRARRPAHAARSTRASFDGILTVDLGQARGSAGAQLLRQLLPDPQHRPHPARLRRRPQHHRGDRGGADDAACRSCGSNRSSPAARPASRFGQLTADSEFFFSDLSLDVPAKRLADHCGRQPAERGRRLSALDAGRPAQGRSDRECFVAAWLCSTAIPPGPGAGDEQLRNRYGLNFRVQRSSRSSIGEAQFQRNFGKKDDKVSPRTLRLGGWGHFGQFDDQRFAIDGTLLADPAGSGEAIRHRGNSGIYAVIDQQLYRLEGRRPAQRYFGVHAACRSARPTAT